MRTLGEICEDLAAPATGSRPTRAEIELEIGLAMPQDKRERCAATSAVAGQSELGKVGAQHLWAGWTVAPWGANLSL